MAQFGPQSFEIMGSYNLFLDQEMSNVLLLLLIGNLSLTFFPQTPLINAELIVFNYVITGITEIGAQSRKIRETFGVF